MKVSELYEYAYLKQSLTEVYDSPDKVPEEFLLDWYKDAFDYERMHSDEEVKRGG